MIRPLTLLSLLAAGGAGLHLYSVKHEVSTLERQLRDIGRQTETARERTAVLRAEWALLNEPERLRAAAIRHLPLETMQTAQFVRSADMERRLPNAVSFAGAPSLFAAGGTMVAAVIPAAVAAASPTANAPQPVTPARPGAPAAAQTPASPPAASAPTTAARPAAPVQVAAARNAPRPAESARAEPARAAVPEPARRAPEVVQAAAPAVPTVRPAIYLAPAQRAPDPPIAAGSALGGANRPMLAPPVPFGAASAATPQR